MGYTNLVLGTVTLSVIDMDVKKVNGTVKQKLGKNLVYHSIPGLDKTDYSMNLNCVITSNLDTNRTKILSLDDASKHNYSDGLITASVVIVPGTLIFKDSGEKPLHYEFSVELIEY